MKFTKKQREAIEELKNRKARTMARVLEILTTICQDNKDIFKKEPEKRVKETNEIIESFKFSKEANFNKLEETVRDIAGTRITCCTMDEITEAENLIRKHPDIKSCKVLKNYNDPPDDEGYRGHHLEVTVKLSYGNKTITDFCEIQIRTLASDLWAVLSHRDFYKSSHTIPETVRNDMKTLSKQLEVVDSLALSLKNRIREEVDKEAAGKSADKLFMEDMLTHENITELIKKQLRVDIPISLAYRIIQYALNAKITSLKTYKALLRSKKFKDIIEEPYNKLGIKPRLDDYLFAPISLDVKGEDFTKNILEKHAKSKYEETMKSVEKGIDISKAELQKKSKTSSTK